MKNAYRTWIEIDKNIFERNIDLLKSKLKHGVKFVGIVKANAYGHGIVQISKILSKKNPAFLAVAYIEEAIELRRNNIAVPILMLCQPFVEDINEVIEYGITPTVYAIDFVKKLSVIAIGKKKIVPIHIKIETGLNRLGLPIDIAYNAIEAIAKLHGIKIEGIYTHFANAYGSNQNFTRKQFRVFDSIIKKAKENAIYPTYIHAANSAAHVWAPESQCNLVRFGLAMYGLQPSTEKSYPLPIRQCFTWKTKILRIKEIEKGENVGYGNNWHAPGEMKIATIAVGYSDGFRRTPYNFEYVLCKGYKAKIVSNVTMSQTMVDVSHIPNISLDDDVVIIGKQGDNMITFEEIAFKAKTINEEIATSISSKIPRIYTSS